MIQTVGFSRMSVLDGYLKSGFVDEGADVSVETQSRNGVDIHRIILKVQKDIAVVIDLC